MHIMLPEYEGRSRQLLHDDKSRFIVVVMLFISGGPRVCLVLWQSSYYILGTILNTFQDFSFDAQKPRKWAGIFPNSTLYEGGKEGAEEEWQDIKSGQEGKGNKGLRAHEGNKELLKSLYAQ